MSNGALYETSVLLAKQIAVVISRSWRDIHARHHVHVMDELNKRVLLLTVWNPEWSETTSYVSHILYQYWWQSHRNFEVECHIGHVVCRKDDDGSDVTLRYTLWSRKLMCSWVTLWMKKYNMTYTAGTATCKSNVRSYANYDKKSFIATSTKLTRICYIRKLANGKHSPVLDVSFHVYLS